MTIVTCTLAIVETLLGQGTNVDEPQALGMVLARPEVNSLSAPPVLRLSTRSNVSPRDGGWRWRQAFQSTPSINTVSTVVESVT